MRDRESRQIGGLRKLGIGTLVTFSTLAAGCDAFTAPRTAEDAFNDRREKLTAQGMQIVEGMGMRGRVELTEIPQYVPEGNSSTVEDDLLSFSWTNDDDPSNPHKATMLWDTKVDIRLERDSNYAPTMELSINEYNFARIAEIGDISEEGVFRHADNVTLRLSNGDYETFIDTLPLTQT